MLTSIDVEKAFDKKHPLMIKKKKAQQAGYKRNVHQPSQGLYEKSTVNIKLSGKFKILSSKFRNKTGMPTLAISI